jgi:uncharacterized protein with ATP-grasp and redox domains
MKMTPECLPCLMKQAMLAAQKITHDPDRLFETLQEASKLLPTVSQQLTPAEASTLVARAVTAHLGVENPYREQKVHYNRLALQVYDALKAYVQQSPDPLEAAVRVAAMGNAMDLSILESVDVAAVAQQVKGTPWAIDHMDHFRCDVAAAQQILYLGDNAGEIVFDRVLVEALPAGKVTFAVKSGAIVNDVTLDDAQQVGMDRVARIIGTGSNYLGAPLNQCSPEFRAVFDASQVIISKGQANFETLSDVDANIYFILKTKCWPVARELGVRMGDIVLFSQRVARDMVADNG